jgi:MurNAc alpha-1-phosphate uridylyltransferase
MSVPRRAIVLAAGFGTRMKPLSEDLPKPLMPFWGRPLIDRTFDLLHGWGVREVLVNAHHGADELVAHLRSVRCGMKVDVSFEPGILGTGGALKLDTRRTTQPAGRAFDDGHFHTQTTGRVTIKIPHG